MAALTPKDVLNQWRSLPLVLRVIAIVAVVDILVVLYAVLSLDDDVDRRVAQIDQKKSELAALDQKVALTRKEIEQLPDLRKLYDSAIANGLLADQDRLKFVTLAQDLAKDRHLSDFHFKLSPEMSTPMQGAKYRMVSTNITLTNTGLVDGDIIDFWNEVLSKSQSHYLVNKASIERVGEIKSALSNIKAGTPATLTKAELEFQLQTMRQPVVTEVTVKADAKAAPAPAAAPPAPKAGGAGE